MHYAHGEYMGLSKYWCQYCEKIFNTKHDHFSNMIAVAGKLNLLLKEDVSIKTFAGDFKDKITLPCGATSSKLSLRMDLVPEIFIRRVAKRYTEGAAKHGDYNYRKGLTDPEFIQERIAHLRLHLSDWLMGINTQDDNLSAVAWGIAFLMEVEETSQGREALLLALKTMNNVQTQPKMDKIPDLSERAL